MYPTGYEEYIRENIGYINLKKDIECQTREKKYRFNPFKGHDVNDKSIERISNLLEAREKKELEKIKYVCELEISRINSTDYIGRMVGTVSALVAMMSILISLYICIVNLMPIANGELKDLLAPIQTMFEGQDVKWDQVSEDKKEEVLNSTSWISGLQTTKKVIRWGMFISLGVIVWQIISSVKSNVKDNRDRNKLICMVFSIDELSK